MGSALLLVALSMLWTQACGLSVGQDTCMFLWLRESGFHEAAARKYETTLNALSMAEADIKKPSYGPECLRFVLDRNITHAMALKGCITRTSPKCKNFNPCQRNGTCVFDKMRETSVCKCRLGLTGNLCEKDVNECLASPCSVNAVCNNTHGSYICKCKAGYHGDGKKCEKTVKTVADLEKEVSADLKEITKDLKEVEGEVKGLKTDVQRLGENNCQDNPCYNGGKCVDQVNSYICICPEKFTGPTCQQAKPVY